MIEAAARMLRRDGYAATGWRSVVAEAGTPWGSLHHCFPGGKEELVAEAIKLGRAGVNGALERALSEGADIVDGVRRWFALAAGNLAASDYLDGCPVATVALETAPRSPRLSAACADEVRAWITRLARAVEEAGAPWPRAEELATVIVSSFEGALLTARLAQDTTAITLTAEAMSSLLVHALDVGEAP